MILILHVEVSGAHITSIKSFVSGRRSSDELLRNVKTISQLEGANVHASSGVYRSVSLPKSGNRQDELVSGK